ncbi:hypothetical protein N7481_000070 [Penicillium waksmanii]|uniref:uncharacterized protein n=1 Tax=Penicillium waksmanii TaxID=69791 RepID=UPI002547D2FD|nr:uncharacterized protein N7481_000070 [Penicillium waksmanii]KAJ5999661.1 hypothetical protein N7481_000070 [Penicillium waksmanii]
MLISIDTERSDGAEEIKVVNLGTNRFYMPVNLYRVELTETISIAYLVRIVQGSEKINVALAYMV